MKCLLLAFSRLKQYYKKDRLVFLLYSLGSILCVLMFLFAYGNMLSSKYIESSNDPIYRRYSIPVPRDGDTVTPGSPVRAGGTVDLSLFQKLEGEPIQSIKLSSIKGELSFSPAAYVKSAPPINMLQGRGTFTQEELTEGRSVIILSQDHHAGNPGDTVSIGSNKYEVIGVSNDMDSYIPLSCYLKQGLLTGQIQIDLSKRLSPAENNVFLEKLNAIFHPAFIENPSTIYRRGQENLPMDLTLVCSVYLLVFLSFTFLVKYMTDRSRYESVVYSIVGASRKFVFRIIFLEMLLLSSITSLLAIAVHKIFYSSFFYHLNTFDNITYSTADYGIVLFASVVLSCLMLLPFLIRYSRESLMQSRKRFL